MTLACVAGAGSCLPTSPEPLRERSLDIRRWLKSPKNWKFMGPQDCLAVEAAGQALAAAGLETRDLGPRAGLYMVVGNIPFEDDVLETIRVCSAVDGRLSLEAFSTRALESVHPLLTFRCLPNMPAFHISASFGLTGPYLVTYPGPGQAFLALERALIDLAEERIDLALWVGVAHRRNFLVGHLEDRLAEHSTATLLRDGAACLVLARHWDKRLASLLEVEISYTASDPFAEDARRDVLRLLHRPEADARSLAGLGAAGPPAALVSAFQDARGTGSLELESRDGIRARCSWEAG